MGQSWVYIPVSIFFSMLSLLIAKNQQAKPLMQVHRDSKQDRRDLPPREPAGNGLMLTGQHLMIQSSEFRVEFPQKSVLTGNFGG